jgi:hypothetical protein
MRDTISPEICLTLYSARALFEFQLKAILVSFNVLSVSVPTDHATRLEVLTAAL